MEGIGRQSRFLLCGQTVSKPLVLFFRGLYTRIRVAQLLLEPGPLAQTFFAELK